MPNLNIVFKTFMLCLIFCLTSRLEAARFEKVVIIGAGPAGLAAAIFAGREELSALVIDTTPADSQMLLTSYLIENYPGFPEGINSILLHNRMKDQALKFGARFVTGIVEKVDLSVRPFRLMLKNGKEVLCQTLIVATGANAKKLDLEYDIKKYDSHVRYYYNTEGISYRDKNVVILGGGDAAFSKAVEVAPEAQKITLIYLDEKPRAAKYLQSRVAGFENIELISNSTIQKVFGGDQSEVTGVQVYNEKTKSRSDLSTDSLIIAIGIEPDSSLFKKQLDLTKEGYIVTRCGSTMTSVDGVFAAGDVADPIYRKIVTAVGFGSMAGMDVKRYLEEGK